MTGCYSMWWKIAPCCWNGKTKKKLGWRRLFQGFNLDL